MSKSFFLPAVMCITLCASCKSVPLEFIPVDDVRISQTVELPTIDDYEKLIKQKKITFVYYTDEYFIVDVNSVMYLLRSRGYKSFHDYKEGRLSEPEANSIFKPGYPLKRGRNVEKREGGFFPAYKKES